MNVKMMLADSCQAVNNKLYILGGGWSFIGAAGAPFSVVIQLEVEPTAFGVEHKWRLALEDADGRPALVNGPKGPTPLVLEDSFTPIAPDGLPAGTSGEMPIVANFAPIALPAGSRFMFRFSVDDETLPGGALAFNTRPE